MAISSTPSIPPAPEEQPQALPAPVAVQPSAELSYAREIAAARIKRSANWFYWIAGLSAVNSVAALLGTGFHFVIGLGITQIVDAYATHFHAKFGAATTVLAVGIDMTIIGVWVGFGLWSSQRKAVAFYIGMALYALDGAILLRLGDWLAVAFHGYALYNIYVGVQALKALHELEADPRLMPTSRQIP